MRENLCATVLVGTPPRGISEQDVPFGIDSRGKLHWLVEETTRKARSVPFLPGVPAFSYWLTRFTGGDGGASPASFRGGWSAPGAGRSRPEVSPDTS